MLKLVAILTLLGCQISMCLMHTSHCNFFIYNPNSLIEKMFLRKANINDCKLFFDWTNDKVVRKNSFHTDVIKWRDHQEWFKGKLNNSNSYLYIVENNQDKIGQVRFDCVDGKALIDYSISRNFRGKGFGKQTVARAIEKIKHDFLGVNVIEAKVKTTNIASSKIFLGLNFNKQNATKGIVIYQLELVK